MIFHDMEQLKEHLVRDAKEISLNPVRFINVDSMLAWNDVKKQLVSLSEEFLCLSKFCVGDDTTPNINRVRTEIKKTTKSQFVTPLSEYLRIIPEQAATIIGQFIHADYQNNDSGRIRIYFLMYRMKNLLQTIPNDDPRAKNCIVLYETSEESDYRLTIVQKDLGIRLSGNEIDGFKNYLSYWEANPDNPLILYTDNAIHFERNHFFDDVQVIVSSYDIMKYKFNLNVAIGEELGTTKDWNQLVRIVADTGSFEQACHLYFTVTRYSSDLLQKWNTFDPFGKWFLWLWAKTQIGKGYDIECAKKSTGYEQFIDELFCRIISSIKSSDFIQKYQARKKILSYLQIPPTNIFWERINSIAPIEALSYLTNLTDIERKAIFDIIATLPYEKSRVVLSVLKYVYPQLYFYLRNDEQPNIAGLSEKHECYFSEYKWLKVTNNITESFVKKVQSIAMEKGASVFELSSRNQYIAQHYDDGTIILFVDGMGAEYIDYLAYIFSDIDRKYYSTTFNVGFCNLPSITEMNKDFMTNREVSEPPIRELDELKHGNNEHPESIIKQLSILDGLKDRILGLLTDNIRKVIVTSDHGTSRLAVSVRNTPYDMVYPKPDDSEVYKYGRYTESKQDSEIYHSAIQINDMLIFADYSRFSQKGSPIDEIHGGASLEEWLVPIITIERLFKRDTENIIVVTPQKTKYKPQIGTKRVKVIFSVSGGMRDNLTVRVKGKSIKCKWDEGMYSFEFVPAKQDTLLAIKVVDSEILGQFDIQIEHGIKQNDAFDI